MKLDVFLKKNLLKLHEFVIRRWLIVSIFLSTSSIWFSLILSFWGEELNLITSAVKGKRQFTIVGLILTILIISFSCLLAAAQRCYEYCKFDLNEDKLKLIILENVDVEINTICNNKFITLTQRLWEIKQNNIHEFPENISKPCEQLKYITEKINDCLCKLLSQNEYSINENELYISLYYNFPLENESWYRAKNIFPEKGLNIDELINGQTTFSKVLKSKEKFIFYNSKEQARKTDNYISDGDDKLDDNNELKGSIACYRIIIKESGQELIKAVLSITTYNKKFVNSENKKVIDNVKFNMETYILDPFVKRINIELCLLYLSFLHNSKK